VWFRGPHDAVKSNSACTKRMNSARGRSLTEYSLWISARTEFQFLVMAGACWCRRGLVLGSDGSSGFSSVYSAFMPDGLG
jgi:hypothetical protein